MKFKSLKDRVVVITGASSGIGKLAVEEFLKEGAKVAMGARSLEEMEEHLMELGVDQQHAMPVQVDVSDYGQVRYLADRAIQHFGHIDVWINNAGVSIYGPLYATDPDEISRVVDVNLKGEIYGSKVAIEVFKERGYGNLINVSSIVGRGSAPFQSVYVATKQGIAGLSSALREELLHKRKFRDISVSTLMPGSMDTPLFRHARSKIGVLPKPYPPVYDPMVTVRSMIACAKNPRPEVVAGGVYKSFELAYRLFPGLYEKYQGAKGVQKQLTNIPEPLEGNDNLFSPQPGTYHIRGEAGTTRERMMKSAKKAAPGAGVALGLLVAGAWLARRRFAT